MPIKKPAPDAIKKRDHAQSMPACSPRSKVILGLDNQHGIYRGDRGFESSSLQRGVTCEPDFRSVEVGRIGTAMAPCARHRHPSDRPAARGRADRSAAAPYWGTELLGINTVPNEGLPGA
jgi:hypothetical protein